MNIKAIISLHLLFDTGALLQNMIRMLCQAENALKIQEQSVQTANKP